MFDTKLKLRYLLLDLKIMTEKSGFVRTQQTTLSFLRGLTTQIPLVEVLQIRFFLILVDLVEVEELRVHGSGFLQRLTMRSKEWKILTLIRSLLFSIITFLLYIGLAIEFSQNFIYQLVLDF
jgi:hypothetical protein